MIRELTAALTALDPIEQIAKDTHGKTGVLMDYASYWSAFEKTRVRTPEGVYHLFPKETGVEIRKVPRYVDMGVRCEAYIVLLYVGAGAVDVTIEGKTFRQENGSFLYLPEGTNFSTCIDEGSLLFEIRVEKEVFWELGLRDSFHLHVPMCYPTEQDELVRDYVFILYDNQERDPELYAQTTYYQFFAMATYLAQRYFDRRNDLTELVYSHPQMREILSYIAYHYSTVTLSELAEEFHFSVPYLSSLIHKETGQPFSTLLRNYRLERAEKLLRASQLTVEEIARTVGFKESAQFIRAFKAKNGVTPAKYRAGLEGPWIYRKE